MWIRQAVATAAVATSERCYGMEMMPLRCWWPCERALTGQRQRATLKRQLETV